MWLIAVFILLFLLVRNDRYTIYNTYISLNMYVLFNG